MAKRDKTVTVDIFGDGDSRDACGCSIWRASVGDRDATIVHPHRPEDRERINGAWYEVSCGTRRAEFVHSRDFGAALAVARRMLGVRS